MQSIMNTMCFREENLSNYLLLTAILIRVIMVGLVSILKTILFAVANLDGMESCAIKKLSSAH